MAEDFTITDEHGADLTDETDTPLLFPTAPRPPRITDSVEAVEQAFMAITATVQIALLSMTGNANSPLTTAIVAALDEQRARFENGDPDADPPYGPQPVAAAYLAATLETLRDRHRPRFVPRVVE